MAISGLPPRLRNDEFVPGEVLVRLKSGDVRSSFADSYHASVASRMPLTINDHVQAVPANAPEVLQLKLPEELSTPQAVAKMQNDPRVLYAEPNYIYHQDEAYVPNDLHPDQWALHNTGQNDGTPGADVHALQAWSLETGNREGPIVAVLDTGVSLDHPDLRDNLWTNPGEVEGDGVDNDGNGVVDDVHGYNANAETGNPADVRGHGTHCAGIIGAVGNNGQGITGIAPKVRIMAIKIHDDSGSTNAAAITRGLLYAGKMGARITSNSWGGERASLAIRDAFKACPALHIMSAGNDGKNNDDHPHFPGNFEIADKIVVAASDRNDRKPRFSNYGRENVDIAAPGDDILSTLPDGAYGVKSGTSMATPLVAGVAALVLAHNPAITNAELKERILSSGDKLPEWRGMVASGSRLNAYAALGGK